MTSSISRLGLLCAAWFIASVPPAQAQTVEVVAAQENFRKVPRASSDNRLATLLRGAELRVTETRGRWLRGAIEGWIWSQSTETTDRDGFDRIVTKSQGENLRTAPDGGARRIAILMRGMLLDSLETQGPWTRVRREAWIWSESTAARESAPPAEADSDLPSRPQPAPALSDRLVVASDAAGLLLAPDGDTTAVLGAGTDLTVLARQGGWTRVRLEGWIWEPSAMPADSASADAVTLDVLRTNPRQYRGRRVEWTVQFVALQQAEAIRTDFYEGEPYFLARPAAASRGNLYVAVPPELLPVVRELSPLQTIDIVARVRTGRSALMGVPILDLIAVR